MNFIFHRDHFWMIQYFILVITLSWFAMFSCRVTCKCGLCETEKQALSEWERHTGSKFRNWRTSIRIKGSMISLEQWVRIWLYYLMLVHNIPYLFGLQISTYLPDYSGTKWLTVHVSNICFLDLLLIVQYNTFNVLIGWL